MIPIIMKTYPKEQKDTQWFFNELSVEFCEDKLQAISSLFDLHFFFIIFR